MKQLLIFIAISWTAMMAIIIVSQNVNQGYVVEDLTFFFIVFFINWRIYKAVEKYVKVKTPKGDENGSD